MKLNNSPDTCPFCGQKAEKITLSDDSIRTICRECGKYKITHEFYSYTGIEDAVIQRIKGGSPDPEDIDVPLHMLQGVIYEKNQEGIEPFIGWEQNENWLTLKQLISTVSIPRTPVQKIDRLLENLARECKNQIGGELTIGSPNHYRLAYARTTQEFRFLMDNAIQLDYIESIFASAVGTYRMKIALKGWQRIEELKEENIHSKQGFIAHWFSLDQSYIEAMKDGIRAAGFEPLSLQGENYPETILSKAFGEINRSRFVVVDLTNQRSSVFVEAGYSMGRDVQTILVINKDYWDSIDEDPNENLEFYATNYNIKRYASPEELKEIVERAIRERIL